MAKGLPVALLFLTIFILSISVVSAGNFSLHANGVTVLCDGAGVGDTEEVNGVNYTKVDDGLLAIFVGDGGVPNLCTSGITTFYREFYNKPTFIFDDISTWDVSDVTSFQQMFFNCDLLDQDLSYWNTSSATTMEDMFYSANIFNGNISTWDVSGVEQFDSMFQDAVFFNQDISGWDTSSALDMNYMFEDGDSFDQDIGGWDVSNVQSFLGMFFNNGAFNQDIGDWEIDPSGPNMIAMFNNADAFYQDLSEWEVNEIASKPSNFDTNALLYFGQTAIQPQWGYQDPYINVATEYDINYTEVSVGGTFFFMDYEDVTAYVQIDGVNQTKTDYNATGSGASQYHTETITSLDSFTEYTWDFCIYYSLGEICEGDTNFTTLDYLAPSINVISAFNITNHEATLGGTVLYNDYENMTLSWYFEGDLISAESFTQVDEFDTSEYYTRNLTLLNYSTLYDYELKVRYQDLDYSLQNVTTCDAMTQTYRCDGAQQYSYGYTWDTGLSFGENGELCNSFCEQNDDNTCCSLRNGYCYGHLGNITATGGGSDFASNCSTSEIQNGEILYVNESKNFTTLAPYIPYITISGVNNLASETATLTGTHYSYDYPSTVPFFRLDGVDLYPKYNYTHDYTTPHTETYNLTNLSTNTTYNYTFCVGYGLGWASIVCDTTANFTTGFLPTVTFASPNPINKENATLHWTIDYAGATNVEYRFRDSVGAWIPAVDGVSTSYDWTGLTAETDYTYYLQIQFDTLGDTFTFNTSTQSVTTAYENEFDNVWDTLLQGSSFAKILLGFVILFGVIFLGVGAFGKYNIQMSMVAVLIFTIIGSVLATLMKLFSVPILLLIIVGCVVLMVLQRMLFSGDGDR